MVILVPSEIATIVPNLSVRYILIPILFNLSKIGCLDLSKSLFFSTDITAYLGDTAFKKDKVVEFLFPWWDTFNKSE